MRTPQRLATLALFFALLVSANARAQGVGINATGAAADTSAILDLSATNKGFLPPRMSAAQRVAIVQPASGLVVYQTSGPAGLYYNVGTPAAPSWKLVADAASLGTSSQWTTSGANIWFAGGNVGIGTSNPAVPLGFGATIGKKVTLFPAGTGDYGFGISAGRLFISTEAAGTDVAVGYDAAGVFHERFAFGTNGSLALSGSAGAAGQVLRSNGAGAPATWGSPTGAANANLYQFDSTTMTVVADGTQTVLPDMTHAIPVSGNAKLVVSLNLRATDPSCALCAGSWSQFTVAIDGAPVKAYELSLGNGERGSMTPTFVAPVTAGTHTLTVTARAFNKTITYGSSLVIYGNSMTVQVVPE